MKNTIKRGLAFALAAVMILGVVLIPSKQAKAANATISNGGTAKIININSGIDNAIYYQTQAFNGIETYHFTMPTSGTLLLAAAYQGSSYFSVKNASGSSASYSDYSSEVNGSQEIITRSYPLTKGEYTLEVTNYKANDGYYYPVVFGMSYAPDTATLTSGKVKTGGISKDGGAALYKIKVSKKGYLRIDLADDDDDEYASFKVQLLNSKKKKITNAPETVNSSTGYHTCFGVKKGTYYVKVIPSYSCSLYQIKATAKKVTGDKGGTKKAKATNIKPSTLAKGLIYAANKKTPGKKWYKFTVSKNKKVNITVKAWSSQGGDSYGKLKVEVINSSGSKLTNYIDNTKSSISIKPYTIGLGDKLKKGTYWICVTGEKYGNGYFTLKWK